MPAAGQRQEAVCADLAEGCAGRRIFEPLAYSIRYGTSVVPLLDS